MLRNQRSLISCSQGQSAIDDFDTQWNLSPQFTKIWGRHTISFGGQLEESYDNYLQTNNGGGIISFNGSWTAPLAKNAGPVLGNDYADFMLGYGLGAGAASATSRQEIWLSLHRLRANKSTGPFTLAIPGASQTS